jgi:hypothetical protein
MILIVKAQIGETGPVVTVRGRDAWALLELKAANDNGCTPIDHPGPRWSGYVSRPGIKSEPARRMKQREKS